MRTKSELDFPERGRIPHCDSIVKCDDESSHVTHGEVKTISPVLTGEFCNYSYNDFIIFKASSVPCVRLVGDDGEAAERLLYSFVVG